MFLSIKLLYRWLPWLSTVGLAVMFLFFMFDDRRNLDAIWHEQLEWNTQAHHKHINTIAQELTQQAMLLAQLIVHDEHVLSLVRRAHQVHSGQQGVTSVQYMADLRAELQQVMAHYWHNASAQGGRQMSIYLAPETMSFLHMHRPERYGDVFHQFRPLLSDAITQGEPTQGLDVGRQGSGYRAVLPIFRGAAEGGEAIAALEVGFMPLAFRREQGQDLQMAVLLRKSTTTPLLWNSVRLELAQASPTVVDDWRMESSTDPRMQVWWSQRLIRVNKASQLVHSQGKTFHYSWVPMPLYAKDNEAPMAAALLWQDVTAAYQEHRSEQRQVIFKWTTALAVSLLLVFAFVRLNRRFVRMLVAEHSAALQHEHAASEQARQQLALALRSSDSGFWEWDIVNETANFSPEWRTLCGLSPASPYSKDFDEWISRVHPADKRVSRSEMIRHIKGEIPMYENEYRIRIQDGSYKWILTRGKVVKWQANGKAALVLGVYSDITERKHIELHNIRQQAALRALNEIASLPSLENDEQLRRGLMLGARYLAVNYAVISEVNGSEYKIRVQYSPHHELSDGEVYRLNQTYCLFTLEAKDVVARNKITPGEFSSDLQRDAIYLESYIGVPLWAQGRIYGTLCFFSNKSRQHEYDALDKDFVRLLARWVSAVVERWQQDNEKKIILQRFQKLSERLPGFLYQYQLRPDGTSFFPYASSGIKNIYNVSPDAVSNSSAKVYEVLHPDDVEWVNKTIAASAARLTPWMATVRVNNPVRGLIWTHVQATPECLDDGSVLWNGYVSDITSLKQTELELDAINSLQQAIFDAASLAIISTDTQGVIKSFNRGAEQMLGYHAHELIGKCSLLMLHLNTEVVARAAELTQTLGYAVAPNFDVFSANPKQDIEDEHEWRFVHKGGSQLSVVLTMSVLRDAQGDVNGYLAIARDISEIKRIDTLKTEFISTVSHELRTPLTAISASLGLLANSMAGDLPDKANHMIKVAHNNARRLIILVNDLLDMEKLVAGKMTFDIREHKVFNLINSALEANVSYAEKYAVAYVIDPASVDADLVTDAVRLEQVLTNFLSNAAKFSPRGETVTIKSELKANWVRISVSDHGDGVPAEFRARIFKKFSQADSSDARNKGGTGLGLSICKEIIEHLGGRVGFESAQGKGASFYFELPCEGVRPVIPEAQPNDKTSQPNDKTTQSNYETTQAEYEKTQPRILIVEDEDYMTHLLVASLANTGYQLDCVATGREALARLAAHDYTAVTLDMQLPDIHGVDIIEKIRHQELVRDIKNPMPIVVITANEQDSKQRLAAHITHDAIVWLSKPLHRGQLVTVLAQILQQTVDP